MINNNISTKLCWESLRKEFNVVKEYIYFNHAAIAPISRTVKQQIDYFTDQFCKYGIVSNHEFLKKAEYTRDLAAKLINAAPSEIAFIKNTTQGIHIAANGIKWVRGDNVIIPGNEFPANVYPWLNLSKSGVETRFLPVNRGRFLVEDIIKFIDKRTKAISISAVSFTNGFRCDLEQIGRLCKEMGIFFIVDAIQALGAMQIDVRKCGIDLLSADAHKWLLGPQGIGFAYISEDMMDSIEVPNLGYKSMVHHNNYLDYSIRLKPDASRFEEGTLNLMGIAGLQASLEMLLLIGIPKIERRILRLNHLIIERLAEMGYILKSPIDPKERSGILSFYHKSIATDDVYNNLLNAGVVCAKRDGAIRISPHCYNNYDDINSFLEALPG